MMTRRPVYLWDHGFGQNLHDDGPIEQSWSDSTFFRRRFQFHRTSSWKEIRSFPFPESRSRSIVFLLVQLLRSDRQNSYEIQSEADILLERQRKEIHMAKNGFNQRAKSAENRSIQLRRDPRSLVV